MFSESLSITDLTFSDALKWRTFVRISLLLVVLIGSIFTLDMSLNEKQFQTHRQNIQAQYAFQLERLVESSADKMIQLSGAASLNDGLILAIKSRRPYLLEQELETLDWHLQADAGLSIVGLFDATGEAFGSINESEHHESIQRVISNESPVWQVDCSEICRILSYTPLLIEGSLLSVLVLAEPLSHVLLRFHHVANIDTGLLSQLDTSDDAHSVITNWQSSLQAVTSPEQSRRILMQASAQFSLAELQQGPRVVDLNEQVYELKAVPFNTSQLVVMTEASSDYDMLAQSRDNALSLASLLLLLGEALLFAFLWTPLSRLKFSENVLKLLADRRFDDLKTGLEQANPDQKILARDALRLGDEIVAMQKKIADQSILLDSITNVFSPEKAQLSSILDEFTAPVLVLNGDSQIAMVNRYFKAQLCLPMVNLVGKDIDALINSESGLKQRLEDVLQGGLAEYQCVATCQDDQLNSYTYLWRFSLLPESVESEDEAERHLLMIGMPLSEPTHDDHKKWLAFHDHETTFLNAKGFIYELGQTLVELNLQASKVGNYLILFRLPAMVIDNSLVKRQYFLQLIDSIYAEFGHSADYETKLFARIEDNEFAFIYKGHDLPLLINALKQSLGLVLTTLLGDTALHQFDVSSRLLIQSDQYVLDVLASTRKNYQTHNVNGLI